MSGLGRLVPPDFEHVEKYPLIAGLITEPRAAALGINWYEGFDHPVKGTDGRYRIKIAGSVRGGHCICVEPQATDEQDAFPYHVFYNQGETGACTGFGTSRSLSVAYRKTYNAFWVYDDARRIDGNYPSGEGSYVRSAFAALKKWGAHLEAGPLITLPDGYWKPNVPATAITGYRWATSAEQLRQALGYADTVGEIPLLNSWGTNYPESVYIDLADIDRLLKEEGEAGLPTF